MVFANLSGVSARLALSTTLVVTGSVVGCASLPEGSARDPRDHVERFNRSMYEFNTAVDHAILRPVARGYVKVTPRPVRTGVAKFFGNLKYTRTIANDAFQGELSDFGSDIARFAVNTTVGIGGVFDPATRFGLEQHDRDFGQTLGKWGLPTGTYLVLPVLGPSDARDAFGFLTDGLMSIEAQISDPAVQTGLTVAGGIDGRAHLLSFDEVIDNAYDPYALVRNVWFQRRDHKVHGGSDLDIPLPDPDEPAGTGVQTSRGNVTSASNPPVDRLQRVMSPP